ncbi:kinase-like protein [Athelia psychrophila]|uniref:Kinase-like protein n=1 Tax=Athelia psychrophila TaxID=1759441 RepID=A0A166DZ95_9AGAM|nr:kinase-like protein [Fibularhizoctonia sp. CBS 109695]
MTETNYASIPAIKVVSVPRNTTPPPSYPFQSFIAGMGSIAHLFTLLMQLEGPLDLAAYVKMTENGGNFVSFGSFGEVCRAVLEIGSDKRFVAVKRVRLHDQSSTSVTPERLEIRLRREIKIWQRLQHKNIVQLLGATYHDKWIGMVSLWIPCGDLHTVVRGDLSLSHRLQLTCDTAEGLAYLHSQGIIHGDLTGKNVLVNDQGTACLIDFGLSVIQIEFEGTHYLTSNVGGATRYRAPELMPDLLLKDLTAFKPKLTFACDIWSLGCVVFQTLSKEVPYSNIKDVCLVLAILRGTRPDRAGAAALTDGYWSYINVMWGEMPKLRPNVKDACTSLARLRDSALK